MLATLRIHDAGDSALKLISNWMYCNTNAHKKIKSINFNSHQFVHRVSKEKMNITCTDVLLESYSQGEKAIKYIADWMLDFYRKSWSDCLDLTNHLHLLDADGNTHFIWELLDNEGCDANDPNLEDFVLILGKTLS